MSTVERSIPPLVAGDRLTTAEFLRRWGAMPEVKFAELIGGVVYMPSPLSLDHGDTDADVVVWLGSYAVHTPGCRSTSNATWIMSEEDTPQPDVALRILPECGGRSRVEGPYAAGAVELVVEISRSSASYDLREKLKLYESTGVHEYVVVLLDEQEVRWHRLVGGAYQRLPPDADGVLRSHVFPGLWLDPAALLAGRMPEVLATLNAGLATAEHRAFVAALAARRAGPG